MRRAFLLAVAGSIASCGWVGSTEGYAGFFCDKVDVAAIFCSSFDEPDAPYTFGDASGSSSVDISLADVASLPATPPYALHVVSDGGVNRRRGTFKLPIGATAVVCDLDFKVAQAGKGRTLVAWLGIEESGPVNQQSFAGGMLVAPTNGSVLVGPSVCTFGDAGPTCVLSDAGADVIDGGWQHATITRVGAIPGAVTITVSVGPTQRSVSGDAPSAGVAESIDLGALAASGVSPDTAGLDVLFDNVVCSAP